MTTTFGQTPAQVGGHPAHDDDDEVIEDAEGEVEDGDDPNVVVDAQGSGQLTLNVGGGRHRPNQSILNILSKQQEFGTTREFKLGEVVELRNVTVRIKAVDIRDKKKDLRVRKHFAVIESFDID